VWLYPLPCTSFRMLRLVLNHVHDTATNGDATRAVTPIDYTANKLLFPEGPQVKAFRSF